MNDPETQAIRARHRVPDAFQVHGHAIVSADDMIAGTDGLTPPELRNEADWRRFQEMLESAVVTVLGRLGHEANPNAAGRRRLVLTRQVDAFEYGEGCALWNPAGMPFAEALVRTLPEDLAGKGGIIAVPGGRAVFDFFLALGYDEFHLARAERVRIESGTTLFSDLGAGRTADDALGAASLLAGPVETLDRLAHVTMTVWRKRSEPLQSSG